MGSVDPFKKLVKLAARAFYDDITITKGDKQAKNGRSENRGIAVVVLDVLTRREWVREEDLANDLKLNPRQLRRILRFFEEEKLVNRDHRKEKMHTHSYCCLDYPQIYDVLRYRLHRMRNKLKDELESKKNDLQEYICQNCNKGYTSLDVLWLISPHDEYEKFHCESCNGAVVASQELELGDGDDNARRQQLKDMLRKMEEQLKPLIIQLGLVKDLPFPDFGNHQNWKLQNAANGEHDGNDPSECKPGETMVEVDFSGIDDNIKPENGNVAPMKVLPPWTIKKGMNLTEEQRGETKSEAKMAGSDDKKTTGEKDDVKKNIQDEYVKAYYAAYNAALLKQQQMSDASATTTSNEVEVPPDRQVGIKSKRSDEYEGGEPNTAKSFKVDDLNAEAEPSDGDDIDWEEG